MTQEIFMPNGKRIMYLTDKHMQYSEKILHQMADAGYIVRIDGKRIRPKNRFNDI